MALESVVSGSASERKTYSYDEALNGARAYFNGEELSAKTWVDKYALKDSFGNIYEKSPDEMHRRLAREFARVESKYPNPLSEEQVYDLVKDFRYIIPQGSPMSGIGNDFQIVSLSNCFVIGNENDSYGGIFKTDQEQAQLMKRRGGVGHDLSYLRPKGSPVMNSALTSTGVVPFMERYSNTTREVAQDGRRGALMLSLAIRHPDAGNFIDAKMTPGKVTGANVSVRIDDEFMRAVINDDVYVQRYPLESDNPTFTREIKARDLWKKIVHNAWKSAEPGILFWDTILRESIPDRYADLGYKTVSTNPCGEIPLCVYDSCRLLLQNLYSYVKNPFTDKAEFDFEKFSEHTKYAQRMMDDIVDLEIEKIDSILAKIGNDPEEDDVKAVERNLWNKIRHKAAEGRRTGLGVTGEGDMIAALGLKYGSDEATEFSTRVHRTLALSAYRSSVEMAKERGKFLSYDPKREEGNPFIERLRKADPELYGDMVKHGRRNIALLTIAPTGSVSIQTQTTSGLENCIMISSIRRKKVNPNDKNVRVDFVDEVGDSWQEFPQFHPQFETWLSISGYNIEEVKAMKKEDLNEVIKKSPYFEATSNDVDWVKKVKLQGAVQKWVDHSISVTVNLPEDIREEIVSKVYQAAWEEGCKGITVYRFNSRSGVIIDSKDKLEDKVQLIQNNVALHPVLEIKPQAIKYRIKRPQNGDTLHVILTSDLYVDDTNKKAYFIPNEDFQIRAPLGVATSVTFAQSGMDRTEILRGSDPDYSELVKRLQSPFSNEEEGMGPRRIKSIEHAVGLAFEDYFLRNGIIERDEVSGDLIQKVRKKDLRKIDPTTPEYLELISQVRVGEQDDEKELEVHGNHGKFDTKFECKMCGSKDYRFEAGCHSPVCKTCGYTNGCN